MKRLFARRWVYALALLGMVAFPACSIESGGDQNDAGPTDLGGTSDQDQPADVDHGQDQDEGGDEATCQNECPAEGQRDCVDNGFRICGEYDDDECLEWSTVAACAENEGCYNGECALTCSDECSAAGEKRCLFEQTGYETCGDSDEDGCLDWGEQTSCEAGFHCEEGACVCEAVCELGQSRCLDGVAAFETCDLHGGACPGWGGQTDCPAGTSCLAETGACVRPYPEGPYGTRRGDTVANECLDRVECDGATPTGTVNFCFQEILEKKAKLITIHSGW